MQQNPYTPPQTPPESAQVPGGYRTAPLETDRMPPGIP